MNVLAPRPDPGPEIRAFEDAFKKATLAYIDMLPQASEQMAGYTEAFVKLSTAYAACKAQMVEIRRTQGGRT